MTKEDIEQTVLADERAEKWLATEKPKKIIIIPGKIINIVV